IPMRHLPLLILFFSASLAHRHLPSFPTRRSSDLTFEGNTSSFTIPIAVPQPESAKSIPAMQGIIAHRTKILAISKSYENSVPERSEEHTSELQSRFDLVCRLLLEKKKK